MIRPGDRVLAPARQYSSDRVRVAEAGDVGTVVDVLPHIFSGRYVGNYALVDFDGGLARINVDALEVV